jgi:hypothetical protein
MDVDGVPVSVWHTATCLQFVHFVSDYLYKDVAKYMSDKTCRMCNYIVEIELCFVGGRM